MAKYTVFCTVLALQLGWSSLTEAASLHLNDLLYRSDSSSCASSFTQCGSSYPADFCCPSDTSCLGLDNNSSILCCPSGSDCTFIQPIICDVQAQNATADPTATVKTTRLSDDLPTCGTGCCPFGYSCAKNSTCVLDQASSSEATTSVSGSGTTAAPSTLSTSITAATPTLSLTAPSTATATASSALSSSSTQAQVSTTCQDFQAKAIAAGFFPGLISGALAAAIIVMCRRRNKVEVTTKQQQMRHGSSGATPIEISDPIPTDESNSFRTDFLLQRFSGRYPSNPRTKSVLRRTGTKVGTRVKSFFGSNNPSESPRWDSAVPPPIPTQIPVTPPQQTGRPPARQPSTESIKVYSPPNMLTVNPALRPGAARTVQQERPNTTFSEVMEKVGFQNANGDPYYRVTETPVPPGNSPSRRV